MHLSQLTFVVGPGALLARDKMTGDIVARYTEGHGVLLNESIINPNIALDGTAINLSAADNETQFFKQRLLSRQLYYEVEQASEDGVALLQIKNKDYMSITEDFRKARHQRLAKFMIEHLKGPILTHRDPIWCDVLLRHVRIMHFFPGEIVYREFEK
jgi:hypothetical protein